MILNKLFFTINSALMVWTQIPGYDAEVDANDTPRYLTREETDYIVSHIPLPRAADSVSASVSRDGIVRSCRSTLAEVELCPSAIPDLIEIMIERFKRASIASGTPVGMAAAETIGATLTQMTLNTFHTSGGQKSTAVGINAMRDIINARKDPSQPITTIYFTNKSLTFTEVLNSRRFIVGSMVSDFVSDYEIKSPSDLERFWWHDLSMQMLGKALPNVKSVMRLKLNVGEMYKHKVTISDLADVLERDVPPGVVAFYGSITDGIIDLYPNTVVINKTVQEKMKTGNIMSQDLLEKAFLEIIVRPELSKIRVKGIPDMTDLVPVVTPIWSVVLLERKVKKSDLYGDIETDNVIMQYPERNWFLFYNPSVVKRNGIQPGNLARLCKLAGLEILGTLPDRLLIRVPVHHRKLANGALVIKDGNDFFVERDDTKQIDNVWYRKLSTGDNVKVDGGFVLEEAEPDYYVLHKESELIYDDEEKAYWIKLADPIVNDVVYEKLVDLPMIKKTKSGQHNFSKVENRKLKVQDIKPSEFVNTAIAKAKKQHTKAIKDATDEMLKQAKSLPAEERRVLLLRPINIPRPEIVVASEFVFAEVSGQNLVQLFSLPGIDTTRTICNNMHTINRMFGIEATRKFIITSISSIIANTGSSVSPANICMIGDEMTASGSPAGATYQGISRQSVGAVSLATLERAGAVFKTNAMSGRHESVSNVSLAIAMGARIAVGSGAVDVAQDVEINGVKQTVLNDALFELPLQFNPKVESQEGIDEGLESMKQLVAPTEFFSRKNEDEVDLLTTHEEIAPIATVITESRVKAVQQVKTVPAIPSDLLDTLSQIKYSVPTETNSMPAITNVIKPVGELLPVVSTGLLSPGELAVNTTEAFPVDLDDLLSEYLSTVEKVEVPENFAAVVPLPSEPIPDLPDLAAINLDAAYNELVRAQTANLEPIDVEAYIKSQKQ